MGSQDIIHGFPRANETKSAQNTIRAISIPRSKVQTFQVLFT